MASVSCFVLCLVVLVVANAFNLETRMPVIKSGRQDTYFGFSVTGHQIFEEGKFAFMSREVGAAE